MNQMQQVVESAHSRCATLTQTVPVRETIQGQSIWEGIAYAFDVEGGPQAARGYAWSSPIEGSGKRRFFAVLQIVAIKTPLDAVSAAIVAEHRKEGNHQ